MARALDPTDLELAYELLRLQAGRGELAAAMELIDLLLRSDPWTYEQRLLADPELDEIRLTEPYLETLGVDARASLDVVFSRSEKERVEVGNARELLAAIASNRRLELTGDLPYELPTEPAIAQELSKPRSSTPILATANRLSSTASSVTLRW